MWYVLKLSGLKRDVVDAISEALEALEAVSIELSDQFDSPILEPLPGTTPLWPDVVVTALFTEHTLCKAAGEIMQTQYPHCQIEFSELEDKDWVKEWMSEYKPIQFGRFWICPSWLPPVDPNAINLILDPGLAFGTGTHPTTSLCLKWLGTHPIEGLVVIDYGCGSGILALAACKLGAKHVTAVDIDEQALQATKQNAITNAIDDSLLHVEWAHLLDAKADLIVANILLEPLLALGQAFHGMLHVKGQLVVSGVLVTQAQSLIEAYKPLFELQDVQEEGDWCLIAFRAK